MVDRRFAFVSLCAVAWCGACQLVLDRGVDVAPGSLQGQAVHDEERGVPSPFARAVVVGSSALRTANARGDFSMRGLPRGDVTVRLESDEDGNGRPERGAVLQSVIRPVNGERLSAVLLGPVGLAGTVRLSGTVHVDDGAQVVAPVDVGLTARLLIARPAAAGASGGAERVAAVDSTGSFQRDDVIPGPLLLSVLVNDGAGVLVGALGPLSRTAAAGAELDVGDVVVAVNAALPATVPVDVQILPAAPAGSRLVAAPAGAARAACGPLAVATVPLGPAQDGVVRVAVPVGILDVVVCGGDTMLGAALGQGATPVADTDAPPLWTVVVTGDPCAVPDHPNQMDCDADGVHALPPSETLPPSVLAACLDACGLALPPRAATCTVPGDTFDCDDDSDGQPDLTEPTACRGPGQGTDLDGDALCSTVDPFPDCTLNAAALCGSDTFDVALTPPQNLPGTVSAGPPLPNGVDVSSVDVMRSPLGVTLLGGSLGDAVLHWDGGAEARFVSYVPVAAPPYAGASHAACSSEGSIGFTFTCTGGLAGDGAATSATVQLSAVIADTLQLATGAALVPPRAFATLSVLGNRSVPVFVYAGGLGAAGDVLDTSVVLDEGTLFGSATTIPPELRLLVARKAHRAVIIDIATVLFVGGEDRDLIPTATVDGLTDVTTTPRPLTDLPPMAEARVGHTATRLLDGLHVLVTGGQSVVDGAPLSSAELLDLTTAPPTWRAVGPMGSARTAHTATLLSDGRVLVVGGFGPTGAGVALTELFDPVTATFAPAVPLPIGRGGHGAAPVGSSGVLVAGGLLSRDGVAAPEALLIAVDPG